jgi:5-(carboxyamino)imidazole ribonucleotide mutase
MKKLVGVIMGSTSDWKIMQEACNILEEFNIPYEKLVISAHRTPDKALEYASTARERGLKVIIAGAGGAAHLAGFTAAKTTLPVIGVPIKSAQLNGMDSLLSIVQMPGGIPVATVAIDQAKNAALLAVEIISISDNEIAEKLEKYRIDMRDKVLNSKLD